MKTKNNRKLIFSSLLVSIFFVTSYGHAQSFTSGVKQTTLIELYTSEGCSSCPPAERYLNTFKNHPDLWKEYIPVALHVDYWDYLGWQDRFASSRHTQRQRQFARVNRQNTIYTPGFFVNGQPWRKGLFGGSPQQSKKQVGELKLNIEQSKLTAMFSPANKNIKARTLTIAILGMGLKSNINAGERDGEIPKHDFVLLNHAQHQSKNNEWSFNLPKYDKKESTGIAIVAWISESKTPVPLQAVGGYLK